MSLIKNKIINRHLLKRCFLDTISENGILGFQLGEDWNHVVYKLFFLKMIDYNQLCQLLNGTYPNDIQLNKSDSLKQYTISIKNKFIKSISFRNGWNLLYYISIHFNTSRIFDDVYSILINRFDFRGCETKSYHGEKIYSLPISNKKNLLLITQTEESFTIHLLYKVITKE